MMWTAPASTSAVLTAAAALLLDLAAALDNGVGLKPQLGFNSWYAAAMLLLVPWCFCVLRFCAYVSSVPVGVCEW
jgi:hypothetical protein